MIQKYLLATIVYLRFYCFCLSQLHNVKHIDPQIYYKQNNTTFRTLQSSQKIKQKVLLPLPAISLEPKQSRNLTIALEKYVWETHMLKPIANKKNLRSGEVILETHYEQLSLRPFWISIITVFISCVLTDAMIPISNTFMRRMKWYFGYTQSTPSRFVDLLSFYNALNLVYTTIKIWTILRHADWPHSWWDRYQLTGLYFFHSSLYVRCFTVVRNLLWNVVIYYVPYMNTVWYFDEPREVFTTWLSHWVLIYSMLVISILWLPFFFTHVIPMLLYYGWLSAAPAVIALIIYKCCKKYGIFEKQSLSPAFAEYGLKVVFAVVIIVYFQTFFDHGLFIYGGRKYFWTLKECFARRKTTHYFLKSIKSVHKITKMFTGTIFSGHT